MATDVVEIVDLTGDTPQRKPSRISTAVQPNQTINEGQKPDAYHGIAGQRALPVFGRTTPIVNALFPESTLPPTAAEIPSSPPGVGHRILFGSVTPLANPLLGNNPLASCTAPRAARLTTGISQSQPVVKRQTLAELFRALDAQKTASLDQALVDLTPVDTPAQEQAQAREDNELVLFSDGSFLINAGRVGGCGVAFQARNGKWKGRAVALGVISGSEEAELYGIYEAFKMAADAMIGNARRLLVKTDHQGLLGTYSSPVHRRWPEPLYAKTDLNDCSHDWGCTQGWQCQRSQGFRSGARRRSPTSRSRC